MGQSQKGTEFGQLEPSMETRTGRRTKTKSGSSEPVNVKQELGGPPRNQQRVSLSLYCQLTESQKDTTDAQAFNFNVIYFVIPKGRNLESLSAHMNHAINLCDEHYLRSETIDEEKVTSKKLIPKPSNIFVFEKFKGDAYKLLESMASEHQFLIIGPQFVNYIFNSKGLEFQFKIFSYPVYSLALDNCFLTLTGFEKDHKVKKLLIDQIKLMGGIISSDLTSSINFIIANNVLTEKCIHARKNKIPIIKKEFISLLWKKSKIDIIDAKNVDLSKYECPLFYNVSICLSQIPPGQKADLRNIIERNGGRCSAELVRDKTEILIIPRAKGEKYNYALNWGIKLTNPKWLEACDAQQILLPMEDFQPKKGNCLSSTANSAQTTSNIEFPDITASQIHRHNKSDDMKLTLMDDEVEQVRGKFQNQSLLNDKQGEVNNIESSNTEMSKVSSTEASSVQVVKLTPGEKSTHLEETQASNISPPAGQNQNKMSRGKKTSKEMAFEILEETERSLFKKPTEVKNKINSAEVMLEDQENIPPPATIIDDTDEYGNIDIEEYIQDDNTTDVMKIVNLIENNMNITEVLGEGKDDKDKTVEVEYSIASATTTNENDGTVNITVPTSVQIDDQDEEEDATLNITVPISVQVENENDTIEIESVVLNPPPLFEDLNDSDSERLDRIFSYACSSPPSIYQSRYAYRIPGASKDLNGKLNEDPILLDAWEAIKENHLAESEKFKNSQEIEFRSSQPTCLEESVKVVRMPNTRSKKGKR